MRQKRQDKIYRTVPTGFIVILLGIWGMIAYGYFGNGVPLRVIEQSMIVLVPFSIWMLYEIVVAIWFNYLRIKNNDVLEYREGRTVTDIKIRNITDAGIEGTFGAISKPIYRSVVVRYHDTHGKEGIIVIPTGSFLNQTVAAFFHDLGELRPDLKLDTKDLRP